MDAKEARDIKTGKQWAMRFMQHRADSYLEALNGPEVKGLVKASKDALSIIQRRWRSLPADSFEKKTWKKLEASLYAIEKVAKG